MGCLLDNSLSRLNKTFESYSHNPTDDQWGGLRDLLGLLEAMAECRSERRFYVSSLDPGVGKTSAVAAFLCTLVSSHPHETSGALIGVSRRVEIESYVQALGLSTDQFAVFTGDEELNGLGSPNANEAQVLFTTQQMIQSRCWERTFAEVSEFHYRGHPRVVRIWDEGMLPAEPVCLVRDAIAGTFQSLRATYPDETNQLETLFTKLRDAKNGQVVNLGDSASLNLRAVLRRERGLPEEVRDLLRQLMSVTGKRLVVRHDAYSKQVLLVGHADTMPTDFAPVVILDASARVLHTYALWEEHRKSLVRLKTAKKDYGNLTVHWWRKGGGRSSVCDREKHATYANAIAKTINESDAGEWLVVVHKPKNGCVDFEEALEGLIDTSRHEVHYIRWGSHRATNRFSHISNIILAGTLFYSEMDYEARARAASGLAAEAGPIDPKIIQQVRLGENLDQVLQAACRGSIRNGVSAGPGPCHLYLIASDQSGVGGELQRTFPGCNVVEWEPVKKELSGRLRRAADIILERLKQNPREAVRFVDVRDAIPIRTSPQFAAIRDLPAFREWMKENHIEECGGKVRKTAFRRALQFWDS